MDMIGSRPKFEGEVYEDIPNLINGQECVFVNVNYTEKPELKQFVCISHFTDDNEMAFEERATTAQELVDSFNKGVHCNGANEPLPMDRNHDSLFGSDSKVYSYITELAILHENADGTSAIKTYDENGNEVKRNPLSIPGNYLMGRLAIPKQNLEMIAKGELGQKFSICYAMGQPNYLLNVAWVQLPLKEGIPSFVTQSRGSAKVSLRFKEGDVNNQVIQTIAGFSKKINHVEERKQNMPESKIVKQIDDDAIKTPLHDGLIAGGLSEEGATYICDGIANEDGSMLLAMVQAALSVDPGADGEGEGTGVDDKNPDPNNPPPPTQKQTLQTVKLEDFVALQNEVKNLKKLVNPNDDPVFKAAYAQAISNKGVFPWKAESIAKSAVAIGIKEESVAKNYAQDALKNFKPPNLGRKSDEVDIENAIEQGKSLIDIAREQAKEELGDVEPTVLNTRVNEIYNDLTKQNKKKGAVK